MMSPGFSRLLKGTISSDSGGRQPAGLRACENAAPAFGGAYLAGPADQCDSSSCDALAKPVGLCEIGVEPANLSTGRTNFRGVEAGGGLAGLREHLDRTTRRATHGSAR